MRPLLLTLLLASSAAAQTPDSTATRRRGPSADLVLGGAAVGAAAVLLSNLALRTAGVSDEARSRLIFLYPAGAALGVVEIGRRQGRHGTVRGATLGAVRGTLVAAGGVLLVGYGLGKILSAGDDNNPVIFAGLAVVLIAPPYAAAAGYAASDVQPVVLRGPDGERAAGLALRVAL